MCVVKLSFVLKTEFDNLGNKLWAVHVYIQCWYISGPLLGCSMPKPGSGVGFLRWGDMGDTSAPPQIQKRHFSAISTSRSGSSPGRRVGLSCLPLNQDSVSGSLLTNVFVPTHPCHIAVPLQLCMRFCKQLPWATNSGLQIMYTESYLAWRHRARCRNWTCPLFWLPVP